MPPDIPPHPVILVTGANRGVGLGICRRLITQLSQPSTPPDAYPEPPNSGPPLFSPYFPTTNLTLVLACRSPERAKVSRQLLFASVDAEVARQRKTAGSAGYAEEFRRGLRIDYLYLDLAKMDSIFEFAKEVIRRYQYVTHLVLNAGVILWGGISLRIAIKQFITDPVNAVMFPQYMIQPVGNESSDGLGLVWQSNVYGHYCLFRLLEPLLLANPYHDSRVVWVSSLNAFPTFLDMKDPQLRQATEPYQASKYEVDLLSTMLARDAAETPLPENQAHIHHLLIDPGVCDTDVFASNRDFSIASSIVQFIKLMFFYVACILGSQIHPIYPYNGAIAAVHASLASPAVLQYDGGITPRKIGSRRTLFRREYVSMYSVYEWEQNVERASELLRYCERLFVAITQARGDSPSITSTDSGISISSDEADG